MQPASIVFEDGIVGEMCFIFKMKARYAARSDCNEEVCAVCQSTVRSVAGGRCDVFSCADTSAAPKRFFVCSCCSHDSDAVKYICCSMRNPFKVFLQNANNEAIHELESYQNIAC